MSKKTIRLLAFSSFLMPGLAGAAVTDDDFVLSTTQNLVNLCSVSASDPRAKEAIQMCEGYMLGAYHYYLATNSGKNDMRLVCMPNPTPTRNEVAAMFVEWAKANHTIYEGGADGQRVQVYERQVAMQGEVTEELKRRLL